MYVENAEKEKAHVAEKWKKQYCKNGVWGSTISGPCEEIYNRLLALGPESPVSAYEDIVSGWSRYFCSECHEYCDKVIVIGGFDEETNLCLDCLKRAAKMLEAR